jgi:hypothetical protein
VLYSGTMNRVLIIAVVAFVILFVVAVLLAPTVDLQPSALRAQQWLSLIFAMFSLAALFEICLQIVAVPIMFGAGSGGDEPAGQLAASDLCCMRC